MMIEQFMYINELCSECYEVIIRLSRPSAYPAISLIHAYVLSIHAAVLRTSDNKKYAHLLAKHMLSASHTKASLQDCEM